MAVIYDPSTQKYNDTASGATYSTHEQAAGAASSPSTPPPSPIAPPTNNAPQTSYTAPTPTPSPTSSSPLTLTKGTYGQPGYETRTFDDPAINKGNIEALKSLGFSDGSTPTSTGTSTDFQAQADKRQTDINTQLDSAWNTYDGNIQQIMNGTFPLTSYQQAQIDSMKQQFQSVIEAQKTANAGATGQMTSTFASLGINQTAPISAISTIQQSISNGLSKIADIDSQMTSALAKMSQGFMQDNWDMVNEGWKNTHDYLQERQTTLDKMQKDHVDAAKVAKEEADKVKEKTRLLTIEASVSDALAKGITDRNLIFRDMIKSGLTGTTKEVSDAIENLELVDKVEPGIVGEWLSAKKNDPNLKNLSLEEYMNLKDPTRALDVQQQILQIKKLQKDLDETGSEEDPNIVLGYQNQYAATGSLAGIPKEFVGLVTQGAKEQPKQKGTIVNVNTGVADAKTPATEQQDYSRLYNITQNIKRLKELDSKRLGGLVGGTLGKYLTSFGADNQKQYEVTRKAIVDDMQRMQSGAALTPTETAYYEGYLPGIYSDSPTGNLVGLNSTEKINKFEEVINNRLRERLTGNNLSLYGYSKVDIGGKQYTVGDIVENAQGKQGRVLPDGSIVPIE